MFNKINDLKRHERVAIQIKKLIEEGTLKTGDALPSENELANRMGVSRSSIREALRILDIVGYVETKQGVGTFVSLPTKEGVIKRLSEFYPEDNGTILHLLEARELLEPLAAKLAAEKAEEKDIKDMERALNETKNKNETTEIMKEEAVTFHFCIGKASKNPVIAFMLDSIVDLLKHSTKVTYSIPGRQRKSLKEHENILKAIKQRDGELACALMREHLREVRNALEDIILT